MFPENQIVFLEDSFSSKNEVIHHLTHRENSADFGRGGDVRYLVFL